jgi:hypothetical protein
MRPQESCLEVADCPEDPAGFSPRYFRVDRLARHLVSRRVQYDQRYAAASRLEKGLLKRWA